MDFVKTLPLPYYGPMHCLALPGQNLFHLVLPTLITPKGNAAAKLMFVLCRTCAEQSNFELQSCCHAPEDRAVEGVWTTDELTLALEERYVILEVYEVWVYPRRKKGLFCRLHQRLSERQARSCRVA